MADSLNRIPDSDLVAPHLVTSGAEFRLDARDPGLTQGLAGKKEGRRRLRSAVGRLTDLQARLYAQDRWAVLLIFQAMDAAGKDGTIKHVMSGINPQGCQVHSFKAPSKEELDHDYLWRCVRALPERGRIGIFNRSYYEEVLIVRVHPEHLDRQQLPPRLVGEDIWQERFEDIRNLEQYLARNGVVIRKFFLHVSKEEQRRRFLRRLDEPEKHWKFSAADVAERGRWEAYMKAYDEMIRETSTSEAPWIVVPADHKWYARAVVSEAVVGCLEDLNLQFPVVGPEAQAAMDHARQALEAEVAGDIS